MVNQLPTRARIVIIGGGVGGTSVAYHLAQLGQTDVVLVDRNDLTSGSTFHSAGMVGQLRADPTLTKMNMHSANLYRELQNSETPPSWVECGSIKIASSNERMEEIRRQIGWAKTFGLDLHEISKSEIKERFPLINLDGVVGGCIMTTDGQVDPSQLALSMAAGARKLGVQIHTFTRVLEIKTENGKVSSVVTDKGEIECEIVVNCGGIYAAEIGRLVAVRIPIVPMSHQYLITENFLDPSAPVMASLRDPDNLIYFRQEVQGLLMGGYERTSKPWKTSRESLDEIPKNFNNMLLPDDWDRFEEIAANSQMRVPKMAELGIKSFINGPEAFTPDNEFCLGETEVGGFYVAAGYCAHGIAGAGGIGKVMAEWIVGNEPPMDLWHMDIRRFGLAYKSPAFTLDRIQENYEQYYDIHYPQEERQTCRPHKTSPAYQWHLNNHAEFGEKSSWERVNFYRNHVGTEATRPFGWAGKNWSNAVQIEHAATREGAGIFDESSFAKIEVSGSRAGEFLEFVCANDVVRGIGRTTYTQALNSKGGIECDFTVTQLDQERFLIVTGTAFAHHDIGWLRKLKRENGFDAVLIEDITDRLAIFGIWGPKSREILQSLTSEELSNEAFPFMYSKEIEISGVKLRATRITYVGELGYELYIPVEVAPQIWEQLYKAGGFPCGYRAIESLRLEKGYLAWGGEINTEYNPYEAGLSFAISKKKKTFYGSSALPNLIQPTRKLVQIIFDDIRQVPLGSEPIRADNKIIGRVKSGGQGYTINKAIAFAYLPIENCAPGTELDVEFFGVWHSGKVAATPLFDPTGSKIKG
jgi:4-methylaminobutanoate oxidase (formaldehyde-forming)